jgi:uncharacterized repeat protein (TIGR04138 family)
MKPVNFEEAIVRIRQRDRRYAADAYLFIREALDHTVHRLNRPAQGPLRHVTGRELLEGIRQFATDSYGPMALRVLTHWGLRRTEDVGEIVFNLVEAGALGKTESDRREDFAGGYDFDAAFAAPFRPAAPARRAPRRGPPPPRGGASADDLGIERKEQDRHA